MVINNIMFDPKEKIPCKFCAEIFIKSVSRMGVLNGGTWRTLTVPDWILRQHGHL